MIETPDDSDSAVLYEQTVRDLDLQLLLGDTIVALLQHDKDEFAETGYTYIELGLASGRRLRCYGDGLITLYHPDDTSVSISTRGALDDSEEDG